MTHIQQNNTNVSDYNKNDDNKITHNNTTKWHTRNDNKMAKQMHNKTGNPKNDKINWPRYIQKPSEFAGKILINLTNLT